MKRTILAAVSALALLFLIRLARDRRMRALQPKAEHHRWGSQESLIAAMMDPAFYPKQRAEVIHKETHISHVFLAGDLVYKIKKPVRYSFVDYSTLAKRGRFVQEELRLNRRLAPSVYLGISAIMFDGSNWALDGSGSIREYTLLMRRLPERRMLPVLLESGQATPDLMRALAEVLAAFHSTAERVVGAEASRHLNTVEEQWRENVADLSPFAGRLFDAGSVAAVDDFGREFISRHRHLFQHRAAGGWVRDLHGDLHCEHVCFAPEGVQIYDCIEFSPKLRRCDVASEVAFLLMDLEVRGGEALVQPFLTRYQEIIHDPELPLLLPFYKSYRALVRAKVEALRSPETPDKARAYFRFAVRINWDRFKPFLVMFSGLTGSGKSTVARELSDRTGIPVINSDRVRKEIASASQPQAVPFNQGIYSPEMTERTYAEMTAQAEKSVLAGNGAILDATFARQNNRQKMLAIAEKHGIPIFLVRCSTSDETTRNRLIERAAEGKDLSDGRWEIYVQQKAAYEPPTEIPLTHSLELNTEAPVAELVHRVESFLRSKLTCREPR